MSEIDQLANRLIPHYSHFDVSNRLLFTGHSHQAWPDVALDGQYEYFYTCANKVDEKWSVAFEKTEKLRNYLRNYYDDPDGLYCREQNTHILIVSLLSSLDLRSKPKIITTDGEFHSMYRQLHRLEEEGIEVVRVPVNPDDSFGERFIEEMDINTSIVMLSRVYFETSLLNDFLPEIASAARLMNIPVLIDDYHGTNVVPLSIKEESLEDCYFLIGGYKYLQWGEGNCFLRFPKECDLRPVITGWFASFSTLEGPRTEAPVHYDDSDQRFATATYDPSSQFRAAKVVDFFEQQGLNAQVLRNQYEDQVGLLRSLFQEKDFDPDIIRVSHTEPISKNGGFLSLTSAHARAIKADLLERGIYTDARNNILRLGPAPYTTESQIEQVIDELETSIKKNL